MKKIFTLILIILTLSSFVLASHIYHGSKCKNIEYAAQYYITTGIFNRYKLSNVNSTKLSFSNGQMAVVKVDGLAYKSPHRRLTYDIFLEKNNSGTWRMKKIYPDKSYSNN
ncbi:hypothetical protein D4Z93_11585 [Clostridium fermenticellae]|uniref:Uncharacterized protein n=1 Tax=Clostridium fermenticellae TaxID=2068654 RepID=A0A386H639_9CLOT|nr:hypothetical protein [Clostridium fermenticellae]AYD41126.1 hypothetical protein D4Z93_11585 [Clostridium fermenticellae]